MRVQELAFQFVRHHVVRFYTLSIFSKELNSELHLPNKAVIAFTILQIVDFSSVFGPFLIVPKHAVRQAPLIIDIFTIVSHNAVERARKGLHKNFLKINA
jgi:hypothetical protein